MLLSAFFPFSTVVSALFNEGAEHRLVEIVPCICKRNQICSTYIQVSSTILRVHSLSFITHHMHKVAEHGKIKFPVPCLTY
jgi:hypothetical protein